MNEENKQKIWTVYIHTNITNNKVYVGITSLNPKKRWSNGHGYLYRNDNGSYKQAKFARAIDKYGWGNFEHIIWAEHLTKEEACYFEKNLIILWDSINNGYNTTKGGEGDLGYKHSEEFKRKLSLAMKGNKRSLGCHRTMDAKRRISESHKGENNPFYGKKHSEETRKRISKTSSGKNNVMYGVHRYDSANPNAKKVYQYTLDGELIKLWDCATEAAKELNLNPKAINKCARGKSKTSGGYIWSYHNINNKLKEA